MKLPKITLAQSVIKLCQLKNIQHTVISPGSRNAPLTIGFTNHDFFKCYSIVDERCAAFFALGIAQKLQKPVALVCTSGSALLNYYPAIAEAYYSEVPLVVLSADRPEALVGIGDGQTIDQKNVYGNHVLYSANLVEESTEKNNLEINTALNTAIANNGPVHINIPFSEPLYEMENDFSVNVVNINPNHEEEDNFELEDLANQWSSATKKMVLVGVNVADSFTEETLHLLASDNSAIVFTETTSNLHHDGFFPSIDKIIMPQDDDTLASLQPEILITFGGMVVSKKIKAFLRKFSPKQHWHIGKGRANDTYFKLNKHIKTTPAIFLSQFLSKTTSIQSDYKLYWENVKAKHTQKHNEYLGKVPFSDLKVFDTLIKALPNSINLHLGNSSPIRYIQLFDNNKTISQYCNRGTSGIDGCTSTAIGHAVVSDRQTVLITGDLGFLYDSNALWNNYIPNNFRIIVINNGGGGIFRILPGHKNTENFDTFFETIHDHKTQHLCEMYNFEYDKAENEDQLNLALESFFNKSTKPKLLEIITPRELNDEILLNYFKFLK